MAYDTDKVDEMTLALLYLNIIDGRAWKSFDWGTMDRLHEKGFISNPKSKAKSVILSDEGLRCCEELFRKFFAES